MLGRTPLDSWWAQRSYLYPPTHITNKKHTSVPSAGFVPKIPANERQKTRALDRTAAAVGPSKCTLCVFYVVCAVSVIGPRAVDSARKQTVLDWIEVNYHCCLIRMEPIQAFGENRAKRISFLRYTHMYVTIIECEFGWFRLCVGEAAKKYLFLRRIKPCLFSS